MDLTVWVSGVNNPNSEILEACNQRWAWQLWQHFLHGATEKRAGVKALRVKIGVFFLSKLRENVAQSSQSLAEWRICIGRLMCFSPRPCHCFHVTTPWQPRKWDTGRERGSSLDFVSLRKELTNSTVQCPPPASSGAVMGTSAKCLSTNTVISIILMGVRPLFTLSGVSTTPELWSWMIVNFCYWILWLLGKIWINDWRVNICHSLASESSV